ncbi:MAG: hypothetical protein JO334_17190 [Verrucomicrobia bacterium]|nr:hypothetical protein [Verrucomicrobiota bacterium]
MLVFLRRPGGQSQFSNTLAAQARARQPLTDLLGWMADHVSDDLSVALLAQRRHEPAQLRSGFHP